MPIIDSKTGKVVKDYNLRQLLEIAKDIRALSITAIIVAGSGYTGGVMSVADIAVALYFKVVSHDPSDPEWEDRDRIYWSAGHKAPALYACLGLSGYYGPDNVVKLRKLFSGFEGHPNKFKLPGIEAIPGIGTWSGHRFSPKCQVGGQKLYNLLHYGGWGIK